MNPEERITEEILRLTGLLGVEVEVRTVEVIDRSYVVRLESAESRLLIGNKGETLRALQYILGSLIRSELESGHRVTVDVGDYLVRQEERLRKEAQEAADRVLSGADEARLRPMNPAERRLVHLALQDHPEVETISAGEGRDRAVIVKRRASHQI
jgi:spoIIIJ-associated protein